MKNSKLKQLIVELADDLAKASEKARLIAENLSEVDEIAPPSLKRCDNLSASELRKIVAPMFKENRVRVMQILKSFQANSLAEIDEERYSEFVKALDEEFGVGIDEYT